MNVVLVMFRENGERRSFSLSRDVTLIGRREDADFRIPLTDVSRKHCRLIKDGNILLMEDLGSSNGTYHNGRRVQEAEINPGDTLRIGPVQFVVQIDGIPADGELMGSGASALIDSSATMITPSASTPLPPPPPSGFSPSTGSESGFELNQPTIDDRPEEAAGGANSSAGLPSVDIDDGAAGDDVVPSPDAEVVAESGDAFVEDDADPLADLEALEDHETESAPPASATPPAPAKAVASPPAGDPKRRPPTINDEAGPVAAEGENAVVAEDAPPADDEFQFIDDAPAGDDEAAEDDVLIDFDLPDDRKKD